MSVKLNLFVICAVLLKLSETKNCDDIFNCVSNWVTVALSPNSNLTMEVIEDVVANDTTPGESLDGNLLTDLTQFLVEMFSNLIKEGPALNVVDDKTKIYVQSLKVNENNSIIMTTTKKPYQRENNNYDKYNNYNEQNSELHIYNITTDEYTTPMMYSINVGNKMEINNEYNTTATIQTMIKPNNAESDKTTKENSDGNYYNITSNMQLDVSTNDTLHLKEQEKTTTFVMSNIHNSPKTNGILDLSSDKISITEITTVKTEMTENNISNASSLSNTSVPEFSKTDTLNIMKDIYSDDDFHADNEIDTDELVPDNLTDYLDIDYTDIYKDTTNEDLDYTPATYIPTTTATVGLFIDKKPIDGLDSLYPWIATVFIMNDESKQFEYICDGSLMAPRVVLTAARCVMKGNVTVDVANILIILGKRSLQATGPNEVVLRVRSIKVHENFVSTEGNIENDLAIVALDEPVLFNDDVQPAPFGVEDKSSPIATATTGWHVSGPLQPLYLEPQSTEYCLAKTNSKNYLCATLGDSETTCPSYGGLLVDRQDDNQWRLQGIASGSPRSEGVCFNKHLTFTKIGNYLEWVMKNVKEFSK